MHPQFTNGRRLQSASLSITVVVDIATTGPAGLWLGGLVALFDRLRIPATWAMPSSPLGAVAEFLVRSPLGHELAIWGPKNWTGREVPAGQFATELRRQVDALSRAGLPARTLVAGGLGYHRFAGLLQTSNLVAVIPTGRMVSRSNGPQLLVPGVWQMPASDRFADLQPEGFWGSATDPLPRRIEAASRQYGQFHLLIRARDLGGVQRGRQLATLLRDLGQLRDRGVTSIATVRDSVPDAECRDERRAA